MSMLKADDCKIIDCGSDVRRMYEFNGTTPKGERVVCEISECYPGKEGWGKNSLPVMWYNHGYTKEVLPNYLCLHTYVYDEQGCWGRYNPQDMETWDGKRWVIDFTYMLPVIDGNIRCLLAEVVRRANSGAHTLMEPITDRVLKEFKADHDAFRVAWTWDEQKMRGMYTAHELIRHLLLMCEVYYVRNECTEREFWSKLHHVYPEVTKEHVQAVYDRYAPIVTRIYG